MIDPLIEERSRHYLKNSKAAFRLLQGIMLSGFITEPIAPASLDALEKTFVESEYKLAGKSDKEYDPSDPAHNDLQRFFLTINIEIKKNMTPVRDIPRLETTEKKLLIIDDLVETANWRTVFAMLLGSERVLIAENFEDAIKVVSENFEEIFSIFIDINIPDKVPQGAASEYEGLKIIQKISSEYPHLPIVAFTAYDSANLAKLAYQNGAWDYFTKEPKEDSGKGSRNAVLYFKEMLYILNKHIRFSNEYHDLYTDINQTLERLEQLMPEEFFSLIEKNLKNAFKYLTMDKILRFTPLFLDIEQWEEVIFHATRALDTLCSVILMQHKMFPPIIIRNKEVSVSQFTLGQKIALFRERNEKFAFQNSWLKKMKEVSRKRNLIAHQDEATIEELQLKKLKVTTVKMTYRPSGNGQESSTVKDKTSGEAWCRKLLVEILDLIDESTITLKKGKEKKGR